MRGAAKRRHRAEHLPTRDNMKNLSLSEAGTIPEPERGILIFAA